MEQSPPALLSEQSGREPLVAAVLASHITHLAAERAREVCIVPIAFVSDHVETLGEIDHEAREEAHRLGIEQFEMSAGLNDSPKFIGALAQIVQEALGQEVSSVVPVDSSRRKLGAPQYAPASGD